METNPMNWTDVDNALEQGREITSDDDVTPSVRSWLAEQGGSMWRCRDCHRVSTLNNPCGCE